MFRPSPIRTRRWQNVIHQRLLEIEALHDRHRAADEDLWAYIRDPDEPERRAAYNTFLAAGGSTAQDWAAWVEGHWPPCGRTGHYRHRGPRLVWTNPSAEGLK